MVSLCCLIIPVAVSAQNTSYSSVVVEGNVRIDSESVLRFADLPASGTVSANRLNAAYRGIADSRLFEDITIEQRGRTLVISVVEYPTINQISIEGNSAIKDEDLITLVKSEPRHVYNPAQAEEDATAIAEAYRVAGRYAATVTPKIIRRTENRVDVVYEVFEGRVIETERIEFVGNDVYSGHRLRRVLSSKQAGILRTFVRSDTFIAERIEVDKALLEEFYLSRGYLDFEVLSVTSELTTERDAFFLVFTVREGQKYSFGRITASTDVAGLDSAEYLAQSRIKPGETYTPRLINDAVRRMEFLAARQGYAFVRAEPETSRNDVQRSVDIEFQLVRGSRVFVERIDIEGNTTTYDRVIRREFELAEGDPFNPRKVEEAANRIRGLGFFSSVDVTTEEGSAPDLVVVVVRVEEQLTGSLSFGAAYSKDDGVAGTINLSESNVLGRGQGLSFGISTGDDKSYDLIFIEPYFLDRELEFRLETSYITTNSSSAGYSTTQWNIEPSLRFFISEDTRLRVGAGISSYKLENARSNSFIIQDDFDRGKGDNVSASYLLDYDSRRSAFNPDIGIVARAGQRFTYGLKDDSTAIRTSALVGAHTTLFNEDITLSGEIEGGVLLASGGPSRLRDRFHMNSSIMRGFAANGIGPRDFRVTPDCPMSEPEPPCRYYTDGNEPELGDVTYADPVYSEPLGGNYFAVTRLETRFPLGASQDVGISGGFFLDVGSIWGLDDTRCSNYHSREIHRVGESREKGTNDNDTPNVENDDFMEWWTAIPQEQCVIDDGMHLRSAVGFSLFWTSFLGPFRFNFSHDLQSEPYDTPQSFNLELASRF